ncbi:MAG: LuxR C-terminal-related transcriptional regulator [Caldimonas sp.]
MKLQQFMDVSQSDDLPTFQQRLLGFANALDFGLVNATVVVDRPGKESVFLSVNNTPLEFSEASNLEMSKRDPVLQRLKRQSTPFAYDQTFYVVKDAADMWEIQAAHGYRTGLAVALHLSNRRHFLLGMDRETPLPKGDDEVTALLASLQLLAVHAQDAALRLIGVQSVHEEDPKLTAREKEILRWTMEGKTAWEVAQILTMSEHTVNFHLRNAQKKLHASSKHQAVLRALALGIL